jgi:hypothetical protein
LIVVQHNIDVEHQMNFKYVTLLVRTRGYMDHPVEEAVELWLQLGDFNRGMGLSLKMFNIPSHEYNKTYKIT